MRSTAAEVGRFVRRDMNRVRVIGGWRELAENSGKWRSIMVKTGHKIGTIGPHPF